MIITSFILKTTTTTITQVLFFGLVPEPKLVLECLDPEMVILGPLSRKWGCPCPHQSLTLSLWEIEQEMETWHCYREHDSSWETIRQKRSNRTCSSLLLWASEAHGIVYACEGEMEVSTFLEVPAQSSVLSPSCIFSSPATLFSQESKRSVPQQHYLHIYHWQSLLSSAG